MNKIFRKCKNFGLMVRLNNLEVDRSLKCVQSLIKGNIPLCVVDFIQKDSMELLKEIAFKADLFIAVENISTIEDAYKSVTNGAQFFILKDCNSKLMDELTSCGFYYIPTVNNISDLELCSEKGISSVINISKKLDINNFGMCEVVDHKLQPNEFKKSTLFNIVNLPKSCKDYENWINSVVKQMIGLTYTEVTVKSDASKEEIEFSKIFSAVNKCKLSSGSKNSLILECRDIDLAINYFKWKSIYIDPNKAVVINNRVVMGPLDRKMFNFTTILKEKDFECN